MIFEYIIDLLVVKFIQDVDGVLNLLHAERLIEAGILDFLVQINLRTVKNKQKVVAVQELLNKLVNLLPILGY